MLINFPVENRSLSWEILTVCLVVCGKAVCALVHFLLLKKGLFSRVRDVC